MQTGPASPRVAPPGDPHHHRRGRRARRTGAPAPRL